MPNIIKIYDLVYIISNVIKIPQLKQKLTWEKQVYWDFIASKHNKLKFNTAQNTMSYKKNVSLEKKRAGRGCLYLSLSAWHKWKGI